MSEEINKAVELTDEEMDNISGGTAMVIYTEYQEYYKCSHKKISGKELSANLGHINKCDHYDGPRSDSKSCGACKYYGHMYYSNLNELDKKGYDVVKY